MVVEVSAASLVQASEAAEFRWEGCLQLALSGPNQIFVLALEQNHCQPLQLSQLLQLQPRQLFAFLWPLVHLQQAQRQPLVSPLPPQQGPEILSFWTCYLLVHGDCGSCLPLVVDLCFYSWPFCDRGFDFYRHLFSLQPAEAVSGFDFYCSVCLDHRVCHDAHHLCFFESHESPGQMSVYQQMTFCQVKTACQVTSSQVMFLQALLVVCFLLAQVLVEAEFRG